MNWPTNLSSSVPAASCIEVRVSQELKRGEKWQNMNTKVLHFWHHNLAAAGSSRSRTYTSCNHSGQKWAAFYWKMVFAYTHFLPRAVFTSWFLKKLYFQFNKNQTFLLRTAINIRSLRSRLISKECFSLVLFSGENTKFVRLLFTFMFVQKLLLHATLKNTFAYRKMQHVD